MNSPSWRRLIGRGQVRVLLWVIGVLIAALCCGISMIVGVITRGL